MAKVIPRGRGWYSDYRITVRRADGTKVSKRIRKFLSEKKPEAVAKLAELVAKRFAQRHGGVARNVSWISFRDEFFDYSDKKFNGDTPRTHRWALGLVDEHLKPNLVTDVTPGQLGKLIAEMKGGFKPASINRALGAIKLAMTHAELWRYADPQPWQIVKPVRGVKPKLLFYTIGELTTVLRQRLDLLSGLLQTAVFISGRGGLRREETVWVAWEDLDEHQGQLHVTAKYDLVTGKLLWQPKGTKGDRWIPLPPDALAHLQTVRPHRDDRWILAGRNGIRPHPDTLTHDFAKILRRLGMPGSFNTLRHTYASHLIQAGEPAKQVAELMGHANSRMVEERYGHLAPEHLRKTVSALPAIGSGLVPVSPGFYPSATTRRYPQAGKKTKKGQF